MPHSPHAHTTGLSPRVRGSLYVETRDVKLIRSIPARAGEPCRANLALAFCTVYPRACGGVISDS